MDALVIIPSNCRHLIRNENKQLINYKWIKKFDECLPNRGTVSCEGTIFLAGTIENYLFTLYFTSTIFLAGTMKWNTFYIKIYSITLYSTSTIFLAGTMKGNTFYIKIYSITLYSTSTIFLAGTMEGNTFYIKIYSMTLYSTSTIFLAGTMKLNTFYIYLLPLYSTSIEKTLKCPDGLQSGLSEEISPQIGGGLRIKKNQPEKKSRQFETNSKQKTSCNAKNVLHKISVLLKFIIMAILNIRVYLSGLIFIMIVISKFKGANASVNLQLLKESVCENGEFRIKCTADSTENNVFTWRKNEDILYKDGKPSEKVQEGKYEEKTTGNSSILIKKKLKKSDLKSVFQCLYGNEHDSINLTIYLNDCKRDEGNKTGLNIMYVALLLGITVGVIIPIVVCGVRYHEKIRKKLKGCYSPALQENHFQDEVQCENGEVKPLTERKSQDGD